MRKQHLKSIFLTLAKAGKAILEVYESNDFNAQMKSDNSPVTRADKASSLIINRDLKNLFPEIPVLDEENTIPDFEIRKSWNSFFLVDPLDGTKEFIKQNGEFCINLALMEGTKPVAGWIYQPLLEKGWYCEKGLGVFDFDKYGDKEQIFPTKNRIETIRVATSRSFFRAREAELIEKMKQSFAVEIIHCGSSKKQVQMILGNADMYLKAGPCSEWDTAPGQLLVEEFGGSVLRLDNFEPMRYNKESLINPHFVMLNTELNNQNFIDFLKQITAD